ncbi:MAG: hypothetical protein IK038_09705 [Bacteroidaceae bacterium]|nr:hypothetical protein [Bacteroidaceae bacterium]
MRRSAQSLLVLVSSTVLMGGCADRSYLNYALTSAGSNRPELETVLNHYQESDPNPDKLRAAEFLIENMPAHYSYAGKEIYQYYDYAAKILADTTLTPEQQRDSLLAITDQKYRDLPNHTVPDAQVIKADFLIKNIDTSYDKWVNCDWASQVTFDEYLEWMLPYKAIELQELDAWRDTLLAHFGEGLKNPIKNDVEYNTTLATADMIRNEARHKLNRYGLYTRSGLPLLSAYLLPRQTYGDIPDYALTAVLAFRAAGVPAVLDETPVGSRFTAAAKWFVILSDRGTEERSEWDLATMIGGGFFPNDRGPKVYRNTYAIDKRRWEYHRKAKYHYPFDLGKKDVTDKYFLVSDLKLPIDRQIRRKLKDRYIYIASAVRDQEKPWRIVDFGKIKNGHACFENIGREVLYLVLGYDGEKLIPITEPFILNKDQTIEYVRSDEIDQAALDKWKNKALL